MTPVAECVGVTCDIAGRPVLRGVDLKLAAGEIVGVVGANGAGKTTLLRALLGLTPLSGGATFLDGRNTRTMNSIERAAAAAYLPQERRVVWNLPCREVVALGAVGRAGQDIASLVQSALSEVGAADLADRGVLELSGGERARILLARLIITKAQFLAADEPVAGLDPDGQLLTLDVLRRRADGGAGVCVTLHDLTLAARGCDRVLVLADGLPVALDRPQVALTAEVLARAFSLRGGLLQTPMGPVLSVQRLPPPDGPDSHSPHASGRPPG